MTKPRLVLFLILPALALGCNTTSARGEMDPELEAQKKLQRQRDKETEARQQDFNEVLLNLDKQMDTYVEHMARSEFKRSQDTADKVAKYLRQEASKHFDSLVHAADQVDHPSTQARAVGALGFSARREALTPLLNALTSDDATVVNNAVFALGILKDPRTPPGVVIAILEDPESSNQLQINTAQTLVQLQQVIPEPHRMVPVWLRTVQQPPGAVDPWVITQAVRGLGFARDAQHTAVVTPFLNHGSPRVRWAAAIALGRMGNADAHTALLTRLGPVESNPNVRLAVRKALQALAGGVDREYDIDEWRKVFERKR